jgi:hypothetical protein
MKDLPDDVRWHIKEREKTSKEEATYISLAIKLFQRKLKISLNSGCCIRF